MLYLKEPFYTTTYKNFFIHQTVSTKDAYALAGFVLSAYIFDMQSVRLWSTWKLTCFTVSCKDDCFRLETLAYKDLNDLCDSSKDLHTKMNTFNFIFRFCKIVKNMLCLRFHSWRLIKFKNPVTILLELLYYFLQWIYLSDIPAWINNVPENGTNQVRVLSAEALLSAESSFPHVISTVSPRNEDNWLTE